MLRGGLDSKHPKQSNQKLGRRSDDVTSICCDSHGSENRDDIGEVASPFTVLHGYMRGRETSSFPGQLDQRCAGRPKLQCRLDCEY